MTRLQLAAWGSDAQTRLQLAVLDCPDRGGVLGVSQQPEGCGCGELSLCRRGRGERPGAASLRFCLGCRADQLGMDFTR